MKTISINGVVIEYLVTGWAAYSGGVCATNKTPMMAYIGYLKLEAEQAIADLEYDYFSVRKDLERMQGVS